MKNIDLNSHSKILIVGTSGSGKSTLARYLSQELSLADIELDALFWKPNWTETPQNEFREKILNAITKSDGFVIHGNYNKVRDITWRKSEIVIWLDYPKWLVMWRVFKRSVLRLIQNEVLWSRNQETFYRTFLSKDSIILWAWKTYALRRQQYLQLIKTPEFEHLKVIHITNPNEIDQLIFSKIRREFKINFKLRNAIPSDHKYLTELAARSKAYWPYEQEYLRLAAKVTQVTENDISSWVFKVIEVNKKIIGFSGLASVNGENMLDHLWIEPEYIGRGFGKILFKDAIESAIKLDWIKFTIASDPYAEEFYLKLGAIKMGSRESKVKPGFFLPLLEYRINPSSDSKIETSKGNL